MNCPKCEKHLAMQMVGDIEIDSCGNCGGVWLDLGELKALLQQSDSFQASLSNDDSGTTSIYDALTGSCPRCGGEGHMTRVQHLDRPEITMDSCPVCYGIWLDGGEFGELARKDVVTQVRTFLRRNFNV